MTLLSQWYLAKAYRQEKEVRKGSKDIIVIQEHYPEIGTLNTLDVCYQNKRSEVWWSGGKKEGKHL